jgi:rhodanese-related sulfurtransferase
MRIKEFKGVFMSRLIAAIFTLLVSGPLYAQVSNIDNDELKRLIAQDVPVIDVRRPEEWAQTGVVDGSHLLTFFDKQGRYDLDKWIAEFSRIAGPDDPFVLICRTGNRTGTISKFLHQQLGYQKVNNVGKGITHWIRQGNPTVKPPI